MTESPDKRRGAAARRAKPGAAPDPGISAAIGDQLRATYDRVLTEPVPAAMADLIDRLTKSSGGNGKA